jgi:hypothetical protein
MTDIELAYIPATDLAALIRARQLSPVDLIRATLSRIEHNQGFSQRLHYDRGGTGANPCTCRGTGGDARR